MKKTLSCLLCIMLLLVSIPLVATAEENAMQTPELVSISFKNAVIEGGFSSDKHNYIITLNNPKLTPSLENYEISGDADIFITYITNAVRIQTGILVTLGYENGSTIYNFNYSTVEEYYGDNNYLADIKCELGEVYPAINEKDTAYKLYIPSDLEELRLTPITQEVGAYCDLPNSITLNPDQEPILTLNVTAGNSEARRYTLKVKRLKKNCEQIKHEIKKESYTSIIESELLHRQPFFRYSLIIIAVFIVIIIMLIRLIKRLTSKTSDYDEVDFFD